MKPIEQQLQREADTGEKYPGPGSWQVSKVSSGDMEKEILKVEELYKELGSVLFRVTDYSTYIHLKEGLGQFRNIAIEAIQDKYQKS